MSKDATLHNSSDYTTSLPQSPTNYTTVSETGGAPLRPLHQTTSAAASASLTANAEQGSIAPTAPPRTGGASTPTHGNRMDSGFALHLHQPSSTHVRYDQQRGSEPNNRERTSNSRLPPKGAGATTTRTIDHETTTTCSVASSEGEI